MGSVGSSALSLLRPQSRCQPTWVLNWRPGMNPLPGSFSCWQSSVPCSYWPEVPTSLLGAALCSLGPSALPGTLPSGLNRAQVSLMGDTRGWAATSPASPIPCLQAAQMEGEAGKGHSWRKHPQTQMKRPCNSSLSTNQFNLKHRPPFPFFLVVLLCFYGERKEEACET